MTSAYSLQNRRSQPELRRLSTKAAPRPNSTGTTSRSATAGSCRQTGMPSRMFAYHSRWTSGSSATKGPDEHCGASTSKVPTPAAPQAAMPSASAGRGIGGARPSRLSPTAQASRAAR